MSDRSTDLPFFQLPVLRESIRVNVSLSVCSSQPFADQAFNFNTINFSIFPYVRRVLCVICLSDRSLHSSLHPTVEQQITRGSTYLPLPGSFLDPFQRQKIGSRNGFFGKVFQMSSGLMMLMQQRRSASRRMMMTLLVVMETSILVVMETSILVVMETTILVVMETNVFVIVGVAEKRRG